MKQHNLKNLQELKSLSKNERKQYINKHGGFVKFECKTSTKNENEIPDEFNVPEGMTYVEGVISTGELNMNGYKIDINAWSEETINDYFNTWNGLMYYQHDMDNVIGKTLRSGVIGNELRIKAYLDDSLIGNRFASGLSRDFSTGHYNLEVVYENNEEGFRISEEDFQELEDKAREDATTREELEASLEELYSLWTMVVTELVWVEYSLVNVGSNRSAKVKKFSKNSNSINGIVSRKGYNSLALYISEMKKEHANLNDVKKTLKNATKEESTVETTEEAEEVLTPNKTDEENKEAESNNEEVVESEENKETATDGDGGEGTEDDKPTEEKPTDDSVVKEEVKEEEMVGVGEAEKVEEVAEELKEEVKEVETKEVEEKAEEKASTEKKLELSTDGEQPEKEGETPEVKKDNSLEKQTNEIEVLNETINTLSNALKKTTETLADASKDLEDMREKNLKLEGFVEKAREIRIKNGVFGVEKPIQEKSHLHNKLDSIVAK